LESRGGVQRERDVSGDYSKKTGMRGGEPALCNR